MTGKQNQTERIIPTMKKYTMLKQVCNLIPPHLANRLAQE